MNLCKQDCEIWRLIINILQKMLYEAYFLYIKNYNHGENVNTTIYRNLMNSF
jgi:hypothetical protein